MTDKVRLADVPSEIFKTQVANGGFSHERTLAKIGAMSEVRTKPPVSSTHNLTAFILSLSDKVKTALIKW